jgi:hypothetical protein
MKKSKDIKYNLQITGLETPKNAIPMYVLVKVLGYFQFCTRRALRFSMKGKSNLVGAFPAWLFDSTNFTVGHIARGKSTIHFTASVLKESIFRFIKQQDLFSPPPSEYDTAVTVLTRAYHDILSDSYHGKFYDSGVLKAFIAFRSFAKIQKINITLASNDRPGEKLDLGELNSEEMIKLYESMD